MNDADKLSNIPEDIIFKSYLQRTIDHLSLVYDPAYSLKMSGVYSPLFIRDDIPVLFHDGRDILEFAKNLMPENGGIKNIGYLPFLAYFASYSLGSHGNITNFVLPEGDGYVTPENISAAEQRFPNIHGVSYLTKITSIGLRRYAYFMFPLDLDGYVVPTYSKFTMAKSFDFLLDSCNAILHRHWPFYNQDEPDFYKKTDLYCVWNIQTLVDGELDYEADSRIYGTQMYGEFGWIADGTDEHNEIIWREKRVRLKLEIHSVSPFRYKYVILLATKSNRIDYGGCIYDFKKYGLIDTYCFSVIYESPDWCEGDVVWEYEFVPGEQPKDMESQWFVGTSEPAVIIYPEYPDRLQELCEDKIERNS